MIPKIIHLCWLSGDPYPAEIQKCLDTWKKYLPDYEVWVWDTKRFDINIEVILIPLFYLIIRQVLLPRSNALLCQFGQRVASEPAVMYYLRYHTFTI